MTTLFPCFNCGGTGIAPYTVMQWCDDCGGTGTQNPEDANKRQKVHHKKKRYQPDERPHKKRLQDPR